MFPLGDINPHYRTPFVTYALVAGNVAVWVLLQGLGAGDQLVTSICNWGFVPQALTDMGGFEGTKFCSRPPIYPEISVLSSMFMHGGWFHLIGNMWFLHVFGNNIEDQMGHVKFLVFYLVSGLAAAGLQYVSAPQSNIPMVGASGAVSGVMGAYLVMFPKIPIKTLLVFGFFFRVILIPAYVMLGYWLFLQLLGGAFSPSEAGGVAYWAHVGGFVAGLAMGFWRRVF